MLRLKLAHAIIFSTHLWYLMLPQWVSRCMDVSPKSPPLSVVVRVLVSDSHVFDMPCFLTVQRVTLSDKEFQSHFFIEETEVHALRFTFFQGLYHYNFLPTQFITNF